MNPFFNITDKATLLAMIKQNQEALSDPLQSAAVGSQGSMTQKARNDLTKNLVFPAQQLAKVDGVTVPAGKPKMWSQSPIGSY
ncbi:hypothetical protein [Neorhizobium galegae]|uniref:hypothetical protein n=1 Tax=Neorhizobium galegae TaxID=399 RepID=UPI00210624B0|nr:hypothetical protein [Neorhizobium galegae]MCQ1856170.1 hypothetical protein [Neorhizobium galegae]